MGAVFEFSPVAFSQQGRNLHTLSVSWLFILIVWHAGLHLNCFWLKAERYTALKSKKLHTGFKLLQVFVFRLSLWVLFRGEILPGLFLMHSVRQLFSGSLDFYIQTLIGLLCIFIAAHWCLLFFAKEKKYGISTLLILK